MGLTGEGLIRSLGLPSDAEASSGDGTHVAILKSLRTRLAALEGFVDGVEAQLTTIIGHIDGIEAALAGTLAVNSELPAAAALADNTVNPTAPAVGGFGHVWDGATWDRQPGTSADGALVNLGANNDVLASGDVAHDAVDSGFPQKGGGKAIAHGANPAAVAVNDRTDWYFSRHGVPWVIGGHPNVVSHRVNYTAAQTDAAIITVGAGTKIVVTQVLVVTSKATTVNVSALIGFGATTTPTGAGVVADHQGIEPGGGFSRGDGSGILGVGDDGEDLRITSSVPTSGSLSVTVSYYLIES